MNQTNTLSEILILLKEANKDQRKTLFKNILNNKIDKKAFIYTKDFYGDKKSLDVKKIYYKTLIKRKLNKISDNDKNMLSKIFNEYNNQQLKIDEDIIANHLLTAQLGELSDVDYLIRTSGEQRLSNFLLWQKTERRNTNDFVKRCRNDIS